jgi:3-phenylpropionate/cinnamic acid dioxygenase small subunit
LRKLLRPRYETGVTDARAAIAALVYAYAERLDAGDLDGVAALFARATFRSAASPEARQGTAEVRRMLDPIILYDGVPRTRHVVSNLQIDVVSAEARSRCDFTVLQEMGGLPLQPILAGRYHDAFIRTDDAWWFADRLVLPDLTGTLRYHYRPADRSRPTPR